MSPRSLLLCFALVGCSGADATSTSSGNITISATPTGDIHRGVNAFTLQLSAGSVSPSSKEHTTVEVSPWMPAMGHGASYTPLVTETAAGTYKVTDVEFSMPGTWELRVKVTSDVGSGSSTFKYDVP